MRGIAAMIVLAAAVPAMAQPAANRVRVAGGMLEGVEEKSGVRSFKGIPYAAPPVGDLRWQPPQPAAKWRGVRKADKFGPRAMQLPVFGDMVFRSNGMSEDCLYLNVWTPAKSPREKLPVLVYFYGGGFVGGDGSESRYDGESMARKGIVAVTVNYRLGLFGFFAHPGLTRESPHHASGNYGLLDQAAAIQWVHDNIAAFGGDPGHIVIGGESAGSFSVSMQMASPLARHLLAGAIGESGAVFGRTLAPLPLEEAEKNGEAFAKELGAGEIKALREMPAEKLLDATKANPFRFNIISDGYFLPRPALEIYEADRQAHVPLLAGWNAMEQPAESVLGRGPATVAGFERAVRGLYKDRADEVLKVYHPADNAEVREVAADLASDRFIGFGTWKWIDLHGKTGGKPTFRYLYQHPRPGQPGAYHAVEIEYALGNLDGNTVYHWTDEDRRVSATMQEYFANFIKHLDPNGPGLPRWPAANQGNRVEVMHLDVTPKLEPERHRGRYLLIDSFPAGER